MAHRLSAGLIELGKACDAPTLMTARVTEQSDDDSAL